MKIMEKVPAKMFGKIRSRIEGLDMDAVQICCGSTFKDDDTFVAIARERLDDERVKTRYMLLIYDADTGEFIRILTGLTYADALIETGVYINDCSLPF